MKRKIEVKKGDRYGKLVVIKEISSIKSQRRLEVKCDCGKIIKICLSNLRTSALYKSCGCSKGFGKRGPRHLYPREYNSWRGLKTRCYDTKSTYYAIYGGKGIKVCDRWLEKKTGFRNFMDDMGPIPSNEYQIDRIDNNGNYCPENCRWVTQSLNQQNTNKAKYWFIDGIRYDSSIIAAKDFGVDPGTIRSWCDGRIYVKKNKTIEQKPKPNCWSEPKYKNQPET